MSDVQGPKPTLRSRGALAVALIGIAALAAEGNAVSLAVDRFFDRDESATRESFFRSLTEEERGGVRWRFRESERSGVERWEPVLKRYLGKAPGATILVYLFPDPATKGRYTGSSRPADLSRTETGIQVDLDISAPREPDSISPVLASAAFAARDKRLLERPTLLVALGARACGRWWGRDVASFGAFAKQARVEPAEAQVLASDPDVSPVLAVGAAASWIDAGIEQEGEPAVVRTLAEAGAPLESALKRWAVRACARRFAPAPRRALPSGFLRGISYAMSNSVDGSYASPRSRETLLRVAKMSVDSISIMPSRRRDGRGNGAGGLRRARPGYVGNAQAADLDRRQAVRRRGRDAQ